MTMKTTLSFFTKGLGAVWQRLFLGAALASTPVLFSAAQAQNLDLIGSLINKSSANLSQSSWSADVSDPIGSLIADAKLDRSKRDASISTTSKSSASALAQAALNYVGVRYRFGGATPQGFDCSGLIYYTASKYMGVQLPRVSSSMANVGQSVSRDELQPGDLVFFNTRGFRNSHVGIYLGNNEFLHAPRTGSSVRVEKLSNYWSQRYNGARRIPMNQIAKN